MDNITVFIKDCTDCQHSIMCGWRKSIESEYTKVKPPVTGYTNVNRIVIDATCKMKLKEVNKCTG